jgi:hypothetical protein
MTASSRSRRFALIVAVLVSFWPALQASDSGAKSWRSTVDLSMGSQDVQLQERCLRFSAVIVDSSLARLHKRRVANGVEFHRGKTVVDRYPEELTVEVTVTDCVAPFAVAFGKDILGTIEFSAAWRRGGDERPSEVYAPRARTQAEKTSDTFRVYYLSVPSAGVPLTDHLLINVSVEGKRLAQFVNEL